MRAAFLVPLLVVAAGACKDEGPTQSPDAALAPVEPPPAIEVREGDKNLIFSYRNAETRAFATATTIDEVPPEALKGVVVTDLSRSPKERQSARYIYLADLSAKRPDGTYPVAIASRYGFEAASAPGGDAAGSGQGVVVYSASWCGVCRKAKRFLKSLGVPFVEKDIEASKKAAQELAAKASAAGLQPSGVPVIDVAGTIMQGLDEAALEQLLKEKGLL